MMDISEINPSEFDPYFKRYISRLNPDESLLHQFKSGGSAILKYIKSIPEDKLDYRYDKGKWTVKEVIQHIIDTERIFIYRCFRIARHDTTDLAGFDQNIYISPSNARSKSIDALIHEYEMTREASLVLLRSLSDSDLQRIGRANGVPVSARAAAALIIGHEIWHAEIIKDRYL